MNLRRFSTIAFTLACCSVVSTQATTPQDATRPGTPRHSARAASVPLRVSFDPMVSLDVGPVDRPLRRRAAARKAKRIYPVRHTQKHHVSQRIHTHTQSRSIWDELAACESHGHWDYGAPDAYTDGDGFEGGLNFAPSTWTDYKPSSYPTHAYQATREQQIAVARKVLADQGWRAWPVCSARLELR